MSYKGFSWVNWAAFPPCPFIFSMGHINLPHENSVPPWVSPQGGWEKGHLNPRPPSSEASLLSWMSAPTPGPLNVSPSAELHALVPDLSRLSFCFGCCYLSCSWSHERRLVMGLPVVKTLLSAWLRSTDHSPFSPLQCCPFLSGLQQQGYVAWIILDSTVSVTWCLVHAIQPQLSCPVSPE